MQGKVSGTSVHLVSHMLAVSRKGQVQLSHEVKRSVCKRCNAVLLPDVTSTTRIENESKAQKKSWADVRVIECLTCNAKKRFHIGARRKEPDKHHDKPIDQATRGSIQFQIM